MAATIWPENLMDCEDLPNVERSLSGIWAASLKSKMKTG